MRFLSDMRFLVDTWRRIGARLYLALGFAVFLTLLSSAVGVYYFERSGDLNFQVRSESVPVLESSWIAAREGERLRSLGLGLLSDPGAGLESMQTRSATESLGRIEEALSRVSGVPSLAPDADATHEAAFHLASIIDQIVANRDALKTANEAASDLMVQLDASSAGNTASEDALSVLEKALRAEDESVWQDLWDEYAAMSASGIDPELASLAGDGGVFSVRGLQFALRSRTGDLAAEFSEASGAMDEAVSALLANSRAESAGALESAVKSFDQGRVLLAAVSVASVVAAILAAWLWVGNGVD